MSETPTQFVGVERALRDYRALECRLDAARKELDEAIVESSIRPAAYADLAHVKWQTADDRIKRANGTVTKRGFDAMYVEGATSAAKKARLAEKPAEPVLTPEAIEEPAVPAHLARITDFYAQLDAVQAR